MRDEPQQNAKQISNEKCITAEPTYQVQRISSP